MLDFKVNIPPSTYGAYATYTKAQLAPLSRFLVHSKFDEQAIPLWRELGNGLVAMPRAICPVGKYDIRTKGEPAFFPQAPVPRDYQQQLFKEVAAFLNAGQSGIVSADTGWGKTVLGYHAAHTVGRKTLVVTTKEDIYDQWLLGAHYILGLPWHRIGRIRGSVAEVIDADFCVALVQSLAKEDKYPEALFGAFGLVIFDEVHRMAADVFSNVCWQFPAFWRLGLSATISRADGKSAIFHSHIGPLRAQGKGDVMVPKVLRVTCPWKLPPKVPCEPGRTVIAERILQNCQPRNEVVVSAGRDALSRARRTIVFCKTHQHVETLVLMINRLLKVEAGVYVGLKGKSDHAGKARNEHAKNAQITVTTYNMMSEGTDWPWIDTVILAMPVANAVQAIGRVRRKFGAKRPPLVVDLVDNNIRTFARYAEKRLQWYQSIGAEVITYE